jgi:Phospholipase_D-nuclease N-terminal
MPQKFYAPSMLRLGIIAGPIVLALWVFSVVDVISSREDEVRHLPKFGWLLLVLFFPFVGSVAWLVAGRPRNTTPRARRHERSVPEFPEYDRPGRAAAVDPVADEEFLRKVRERAEEQRRKAREQQQEQDPEGETS